MSVRKIPKNHLVVTGGYTSSKNTEISAFESLLEKDYLILLDFDPCVSFFEVQPVQVPVPGVARGYVPDVLVHYHPDTDSGLQRKPCLVEVKHSDDLAKNEHKYAKKFECARLYALERGWEFKIVNQSVIRTPRLANLKFLRGYRNIKPSVEEINLVLGCVDQTSQSHHRILERIAPTDEDKLRWLPIIWSMLLTGHLASDLNEPFTGEVQVARGQSDIWQS